MDTMQAFGMGEANRGKKLMVFDWDKAAKLIKENKPDYAVAGLERDFEWTAGTIYQDGEIVEDEYTYLASTWATPLLEMEDETVECYVMEDETDWDSDTKWPGSAIRILKETSK